METQSAPIVKLARKLARESGVKIRAVGDGLFKVQGQDHLMPAFQIVDMLNHSDD